MSASPDRPIRRLRVVPNPAAVPAVPAARTGGRHRKPDTGEIPVQTPAETATDVVPAQRHEGLAVPPSNAV